MSNGNTFQENWFPLAYDCDSTFELLGRWARTLVVGGVILAGLASIPLQCANDGEYSKGARTGMINKFSKKGFLWKTYEGEMALEGMVSSGSTSGANTWDFSIDNEARHGEKIDSLVKAINQYLSAGTKVKVTYIEPYKTWSWRSETDYLIQSVEPIIK